LMTRVCTGNAARRCAPVKITRLRAHEHFVQLRDVGPRR
jgi:hypothetical protein